MDVDSYSLYVNKQKYSAQIRDQQGLHGPPAIIHLSEMFKLVSPLITHRLNHRVSGRQVLRVCLGLAKFPILSELNRFGESSNMSTNPIVTNYSRLVTSRGFLKREGVTIFYMI
jgi:hypothetical protein